MIHLKILKLGFLKHHNIRMSNWNTIRIWDKMIVSNNSDYVWQNILLLLNIILVEHNHKSNRLELILMWMKSVNTLSNIDQLKTVTFSPVEITFLKCFFFILKKWNIPPHLSKNVIIRNFDVTNSVDLP